MKAMPGVFFGVERGLDRGLECPCCGCIGAWPDAEGYYHDGQALVCGCSGHVSLDAETEPSISISDEPCGPEAGCAEIDGGEG